MVASLGRAIGCAAAWSLFGLGGATLLAGCGADDQGAVTGVSVTVSNDTAVLIHVFGCAACTSQGLGVVANPDNTPSSPGAGASVGWTETRTWPVTYTVTVRGVGTTCPTVTSPTPDLRLVSVTYAVSDDGTCMVLDKGVTP